LANIKLKIPVSPETVFHIGSIGKQFVATGIMLLVQEGRLALDDPISKYLQDTPQTWKAVTVRHLLSHTSGIVRDVPGWNAFKPRNESEVMKTIYPAPLRFAPGEKWAYSNAGYYLLGEIISRSTGRHWTEYLAERIFKPAGMNTTYPLNAKEPIPNRARGYADNDKLNETKDWLVLHPAGGFLSTVLDLAKWDAVVDTDKILSESTRRQMWTSVRLDDGTSYPYGLGWELDSMDGLGPVRHGGSLSGFRSEFSRFPDARLTVIVLMNLDDVDWAGIVRGVSRRYLPVAAVDKPVVGSAALGAPPL
jgi:CubicO group peptidase (beta-lactamase class C family)